MAYTEIVSLGHNWSWCDNNKNTVHDYTFHGNDDNKNSAVGCSCGIG